MEYWGVPLLLIGVIFVIVKLTKLCRHVGSKPEGSQDERMQNLSSNIYIIDEDFIIIDSSETSRPQLPTYSQFYDAPPPYEPPPEYPKQSH